MTIKKKVMSLMLAALFVMGGTAYAQQDQMMQQQQQQQKEYSDEEIDLFAEALVQVLPIQQEREAEMIEKIEENGMELDQFNQIAQQMQQGAQPEGVSEDEMATFQKISEEIQSISMEMQEEVNKIITDAGISPAMYQEMITAYSSNPDTRQKVDQKLAEKEKE